jgi:hypothetical protein
MSDDGQPLNLDRTLKQIERDAANHASVSADTEKVEAEIAHERNGWAITAYARKYLRERGWIGGGSVTKKW